MIKISHIINPVLADESSDLFEAQPVTFKTMSAAREFAKNLVGVTLYSAQYPEDRAIVPEGFKLTPDLERSVSDIGTFVKDRKLPLIKDILDRLYESTDAEYLIYTNADIALQPCFYITVKNIIESGFDAFTINRRTISKEHSTDQLESMYAEVGHPHPGHDCFVFKRSLYPKFNLGKACIGANWIGRVLISNLICHSEHFDIFKDLHLRFHLGDDRRWKVPDYADYDKHNENELHKILSDFKQKGLFSNKPMVESFLHHIEKPGASFSTLCCLRAERFLRKVFG